MATKTTKLPDDTVLIIGAGPVGLMTASVLAYYGVKSVILERNQEPTRWPKMDLTNVRSMELLRKIGLADGLRHQGVPSNIPYTVIMSAGLSQDEAITQWDHVSVDEYREQIKTQNDGTQPAEPYQRVSQQIFERWMRDLCKDNPLIDLRYEHRLDSITETKTAVEAQITCTRDGSSWKQEAKYAVACDGASSRSRKSLEIGLEGGPILTAGGFSQNTFTVHYPLGPDEDEASISSEEAIYAVLGGAHGPFKIEIDKVLVRSVYRPSTAVAKAFAGREMRVFLSGDAAHQNIPTGGYGMNTGLGDAFDIAWKLAAVLKGYGGPRLLESYEQERQPVAAQNVQRAAFHMSAHLTAVNLLGNDTLEVNSASERGKQLRSVLRDHYRDMNGENTDLGIEMGYRYSSQVCIPDDSEPEPRWDPHSFLPTTYPGSRAPHVFLSDGTSILDRLGPEFSLVEFKDMPDVDVGSGFVVEAAKNLRVPVTIVALVDEANAARIWQRKLVLVRPDGHVAWRGSRVKDQREADCILKTAAGHGN
ncbi:hypothetical protein F66182_1002 [Fusarium sp. NRRL 66182]|nr:hypothetical protein F66182_1002 [Fusarium sp. NRRL 66182]